MKYLTDSLFVANVMRVRVSKKRTIGQTGNQERQAPMAETAQKRCTKCGESYPATTVFFHQDKLRNDGLFPQCKKCRVSTDHFEIQQRRANGEKRCSTCKNFFPATEEFFYANSFRKDGLHHQCKSCALTATKESDHKPERREKRLAYDRTYRERPEVRERKRIYNQAYHRSHYSTPEWREHHRTQNNLSALRYRETRSAYYKEWRKRKGLSHPRVPLSPLERKQRHYVSQKRYNSKPEVHERILARRKVLHARPEVRERDLAYKRSYRMSLEGKEKRRTYSQHLKTQGRARAYSHNYRSRKRAIAGVHTSAQIQEQLKRQRHRCYYAACGFAKFEKGKDGKYIYHIDHTFPISRVAGTNIPANDISYLVLACPSCNDSKGNKFPWEWHEGGKLL